MDTKLSSTWACTLFSGNDATIPWCFRCWWRNAEDDNNNNDNDNNNKNNNNPEVVCQIVRETCRSSLSKRYTRKRDGRITLPPPNQSFQPPRITVEESALIYLVEKKIVSCLKFIEINIIRILFYLLFIYDICKHIFIFT